MTDFFNKNNKGGKEKAFYSLDELKKETNRLKRENAVWEKEFSHIIELREKATKLDKSGKYLEAIKLYNEAILFGENSERMKISNYAHDINRVIILYGKSKQIDLLKIFLERIINDYPDYRDFEKWETRLSKIN
ncbi:hypothetical protein [Flagellimonas baculiformis]|uniref:hypothetical protein n=1 Tax=Flagellimonas baculiformis TaxID=3067310 RepID=UPI00296F5EA3|nr:hypothetical protein [Muricauda sp. D6]